MTSETGYGNEGYGFIDGEYVPMSEMRLPVTDLGFQLADMCYDALHVHKGRYFRMEDHLDRFERSVEERRYETLGMGRDGFAEVLHGCVARAGLQNSMRSANGSLSAAITGTANI